MLRVLQPGDQPTLEAFLLPRLTSSMFLLGNARKAGLVDHGELLQGTYVGAFEGDRLLAVGAHCWNGVLLLQAPEHAADVAREAARQSARAITGIIGPWSQIVTARASLGLDDRATKLESCEDLFDLDLAALRMPSALEAGRVACRRATPADLELLASWEHDFAVEALGETPGATLLNERRSALRRTIDLGDTHVLEADGSPVSCSTFNARLPECVQVGGVFTPPGLRGRGHARAVVAGSLALARREGVRRAVLFTGSENEPARRAYLALGFTIIGDYGLVLFGPAPDNT